MQADTLDITAEQREMLDLYKITPLFIGLEGDVHGTAVHYGDTIDYAVTRCGRVYNVLYKCVRDEKGA